MSKYVISDVHGCYNTLLALLSKLPADANSSNIVFVGDILDRGPDSRKVINFVRDGGYDCVKGNHEDLLIEAWDELQEYNIDISDRNGWTLNGGRACLRNYTWHDGDLDLEALEKDVKWLKNLPEVQIYSEEVDSKGRMLVVTHANSIAFIDTYIAKMSEYENVDLDTLSIEEEHQITNMSELIIWNRSIPKTGSEIFFNISGHNIIDTYIFNSMNELKIPRENLTKEHIVIDRELGYACIDTAAFSKLDGYQNLNCNEEGADGNPYRGRMTCIEFPSLKTIQQCNIEEFDWNN